MLISALGILSSAFMIAVITVLPVCLAVALIRRIPPMHSLIAGLDKPIRI